MTKKYETGQRSAYMDILQRCVKSLGYSSNYASNYTMWVIERESAIAALRNLCEKHGDNNWTPDLSIADIINKHLGDWNE